MCHIGSGYFFLLVHQVCNLHSLNVNCKGPTMHFLRNQKFLLISKPEFSLSQECRNKNSAEKGKIFSYVQLCLSPSPSLTVTVESNSPRLNTTNA